MSRAVPFFLLAAACASPAPGADPAPPLAAESGLRRVTLHVGRPFE